MKYKEADRIQWLHSLGVNVCEESLQPAVEDGPGAVNSRRAVAHHVLVVHEDGHTLDPGLEAVTGGPKVTTATVVVHVVVAGRGPDDGGAVSQPLEVEW